MSAGRLRVFVSSRMEELRDEREAVRGALAAVGVDTFLFELDAGARPVDIQQTYQDEEQVADIYVGLFWKGLGPHTVREFEYASSLGMDRFIYERPEDAAGGRDPNLQVFLDRIGNADAGSVTVGRFHTVDQLAAQIRNDVGNWIRQLADERRERAAAVYSGIPPRKPSDLVGRGGQIVSLVRALRSGRDVAVDGLPGIGKTTLALALVRQPGIRRHFRDGVLWASLGPGADPAGAIARWAQALERAGLASSDLSKLPDLADRTQALRDAIGTRRMLLVIDDVWDVEAADALHCGGPHCCHLITTRNREIARELVDPAGVQTLAELDERNALELLRQLAPEAVARDRARVVDLLRAVGGLPQAVRLIGGYLARPQAALFGDVFADLSVNALDELADPQRRLELAERRLGGAGSRKMTLGETIRLSVDDLPGPARACFEALGSFAARPQRFTKAAALEITGAASSALALLASRNLVDVETDGSLSLHPTIADVARTMEPPGAAAKHCQSYLSAIKDDRRDAARADEAYGQLRWAWQRAADDESLLAILGAVEPYQARRGLYAETLAWATRALPVAEAHQHAAVAARVLGIIGEAEKDLGLYERALTDYRRSLSRWTAVDDPSFDVRTWQINARGRIAVLLGTMGRYDEALAEVDAARAVADTSDDPVKAAEMLMVTAIILRRAGRLAEALVFAEQAREQLHRLGAKESEAECLMVLATIHRDRGEADVGVEHLREAMAVQTATGTPLADTETRLLMASMSSRHQLEDALVAARTACADAAAAGVGPLHVLGLGVVADLLIKLGRTDEALERYREQLAKLEQADNRAAQATVLDKVASAYYDARRYREALDAAEKALTIYRALGNRRQEALSLETLRYHHRALEQPRTAMTCAREALAIWQQLGDRTAEMRVLSAIGSQHFENFEHDLGLLAHEQADWLARGARSAAPGYPTARRRPFVPPLIVAIGSRLSRWLDDDDRMRETFHQEFDRVRNAVAAATGILPPPVLLTDRRPDLELDQYIVFVDGVPFAWATLNEDERLFPGPVDALGSIGISARAAVNPFDGRAAAWVPRQHWTILERSGRPLWTIVEYIAWHVRVAMTKQLRSFVGHQQAFELVERQSPEHGAALRRDPSALSGLVHVLRNLIEEQVPVFALGPIVETFLDWRAREASHLDIMKAVRLVPEVRRHLPGNQQPTSFFCLPPAVEDEIACAITSIDGVPFLSMDPEATRRVLAVVRSWVESQPDTPTLVVHNASIRRFARRLVDLEFPALMVLSRDELLPGVAAIVHEAAGPAPVA
jgi:tetratricopeptide (TPR) repeat protein